MSINPPFSNNSCTNHNSLAAKPLLFSLLAHSMIEYFEKVRKKNCNYCTQSVFFWISDWREKATQIFWRFLFNKNSGLKFGTLCMANGGNGTFQLLRPDPGRRAFRAFHLCQIKRQQKLNKKEIAKEMANSFI